MSCQDVKRAIGGKMADFVAPLHSNWLVVWGEEKDHDHIDVEFGDQIRLKTRGDSPLIGMKFSYFVNPDFLLCPFKICSSNYVNHLKELQANLQNFVHEIFKSSIFKI